MHKRPTRIVILKKMVARDGELLMYTFHAPGRRRSVCEFVHLEDVPPFEGESASFELEKVPGVPWPRWVAIRRL